MKSLKTFSDWAANYTDFPQTWSESIADSRMDYNELSKDLKYLIQFHAECGMIDNEAAMNFAKVYAKEFPDNFCELASEMDHSDLIGDLCESVFIKSRTEMYAVAQFEKTITYYFAVFMEAYVDDYNAELDADEYADKNNDPSY